MKIERLVSMIMLLLQRDKVSAAKLAEMFHVTPRTIYRDINTISVAGIPIIAYPGANGGYGIMEEYKIEKQLFTIADITTLLIGLDSIYSTMSGEELLNVMAKVKGLIPQEQMEEIRQKSSRIAIDNTPWFGNQFLKQSIEKIEATIRESRLISFCYVDRLGQRSERIIEPYRLVLKHASWYLQGYCRMREDFRIFNLSQISALQILEETFVPREFDYESLDLYFRTERQSITLKLLVDAPLRERMIAFCGEDKVKPHGDHQYIAYFPFVEDDYMYHMLLQFGDQCECLEPEHIRQEVIRRVRRILNVYEHSDEKSAFRGK